MDWLGGLLRAAVPFVSGIPILGPIAAAVVPALFPERRAEDVPPPHPPGTGTAVEAAEEEEEPDIGFEEELESVGENIDTMDFEGTAAQLLVDNPVKSVQTSWPQNIMYTMNRNLPLDRERDGGRDR